MKKIIFSLLAIVALSFASCSSDEQNTQSPTTQMLSKGGDYRLYTIDNRIPTTNVDREDIATFTNQLLDTYTVVDKDNVNFLPVDSPTIDTESNTTLTAKPKVICHEHPYPDIHDVVVQADNGLYYMVIINDGAWGWGASVSICFSSTYNPCGK
jgi:hypothetical protein